MDNASLAFAASALPFQTEPDGFALGDFWGLTQQAGPLRWPIYFVLAFGLVQVFLKLYELLRDRRVSKPLREFDPAGASLDHIESLISRQEASMLSTLQSTMVNVFRTRPSEGLLHDEISNFVAFQQDQFGVFRRRMEFLSDTAGALGLMGTVWGMFTVFFQGTAQQDVILRGMGIALITTLLGLVVSIILNFSATELSTFFDRRLEQVSVKSDELRFRLMELAPEKVAPAAAGPSAAPPQTEAGMAKPPEAPSAPPIDEASVARRVVELLENGSKAQTPRWLYLELAEPEREASAGESLGVVRARVKNAEGQPAEGVTVAVTLAGSGGSLGNGARKLQLSSDDAGSIEFDCTVPESAGAFAVDLALPEQPGPPTRLEVLVRPGTAQAIQQLGNNQAATAGMRLPLPLGVGIFDRFGNPVADVPVGFRVKQGGGMLGAGKTELSITTDRKGIASAPLIVASEAGQNVVTATISDMDRTVDFIAFGTEV